MNFDKIRPHFPWITLVLPKVFSTSRKETDAIVDPG